MNEWIDRGAGASALCAESRQRRQWLAAPLAAATIALFDGLFAPLAKAAQATSEDVSPRENPQTSRVVVIGGSLAECVYLLDAQSQLVGADNTCTYPAATASLPKVGYQNMLTTDSILSTRPSLVLTCAEAGPAIVFTELRDAGVNVVRFDEHHDMETARNKLLRVAEALGLSSRVQVPLERFDKQWRTAMHDVHTLRQQRTTSLRVLFIVRRNGMQQPVMAGGRTAAAAMLAYAGVHNAATGFDGYRELTLEATVDAKPDIILTTDDTLQICGSKEHFIAIPALSMTPAGAYRRVVSMDALMLQGFGPRLPQAVSQLAQRLYAA